MSCTVQLKALRDRIRQLERPVRHGVLPFGVPAIDRALPGGGLLLGAVHEILGVGGDEEDGAAPAGFAAGILARLGPSKPTLWCLKRADLYGPGLAAHGLDPVRLVLVRAPRDEDLLWAVEEGLRVPGLTAVVGEIGRLPMTAGRRLQLAAERSGVTVLLLRRWRNAAEAAAERERPSAAVTRWRVAAAPSASLSQPLETPLPHWGRGSDGNGRREFFENGRDGIGLPRWRVELLRVRGGVPANWEVEVADAAGHVRLSAGLADRPAAPSQQKDGQQKTGRHGTAALLRYAG